MSGGAKKGALGLAAMLGLIGIRSADDCASAGARVTRAVGDDALRAGAQSGDELLEACTKVGGVCFFVGCEGDGRGFTGASNTALGVDPRLDLVPFVFALAQKELAETSASWVAFSPAPGDVTVLRREPG